MAPGGAGVYTNVDNRTMKSPAFAAYSTAPDRNRGALSRVTPIAPGGPDPIVQHRPGAADQRPGRSTAGRERPLLPFQGHGDRPGRGRTGAVRRQQDPGC